MALLRRSMVALNIDNLPQVRQTTEKLVMSSSSAYLPSSAFSPRCIVITRSDSPSPFQTGKVLTTIIRSYSSSSSLSSSRSSSFLPRKVLLKTTRSSSSSSSSLVAAPPLQEKFVTARCHSLPSPSFFPRNTTGTTRSYYASSFSIWLRADLTTKRSYSSSSSSSSSSSTSSFASFVGSCFTPSSYSTDISDYLLNGCKWDEAPICPDYIGPVTIARTSDGRGRGLFATRDISAGNIILVSNAFATSYNDTHSIDLFTKISNIVKESPRALEQYYSLAGYGYHDEMDVPDLMLFDPNIPFSESRSDSQERPEIDDKRIVHILNVNSFEGEVGGFEGDKKPNTKINGLWLLPSFINHSCCPNATRLVVGEAMFIIASQDIKAKEEINISYTDAMAPLKRREENLGMMGYGFRCECKRCETERSIFLIQQDIREIGERMNELYNGAGEEVLSAITSMDRLPVDKFPICVELSGLYDKLKTRVNTIEDLTPLQKKWILGSFSSAFLGKWLVSGYATGFKPSSDFVNSSALELVEAMKATVPGMLRTLSFTTLLAHVAEKEGEAFSLTHGLVRLALDECIRVYGKQRLDVTMKLMEQSSDVVPFF